MHGLRFIFIYTIHLSSSIIGCSSWLFPMKTHHNSSTYVFDSFDGMAWHSILNWFGDLSVTLENIFACAVLSNAMPHAMLYMYPVQCCKYVCKLVWIAICMMGLVLLWCSTTYTVRRIFIRTKYPDFHNHEKDITIRWWNDFWIYGGNKNGIMNSCSFRDTFLRLKYDSKTN